MDRWDFALKFSSELVVLALAVVAGFCNLYFFSGDVKHEYNDNSHAAKFLSYHPDLNAALYSKNTSIITKMVASNAFIAHAQADDFNGLSNNQSGDLADGEDNSNLLSSGLLVTSNPDSIDDLIAKQIKVYQTQNGDTLKSIASKNGVKVQTLIWANKLTSEQIKPGWFLLIPPTDGIIVKADSNTTLPDLATRYNPEKYNSNKKIREEAAANLLNAIISYNSLADAEDVDTEQIVIVPGGVIAQAPAPAVKPAAKTSGSSEGAVTSVGSGYDGVNHIFPKGYCTYYVASRTKITFGGNAKNWLANAKASGYVTGQEPAPKSVVVTTENRRYGHVAYVEEVTDTAILVSEMNYEAFNKVDQRWIPRNSSVIRGYIYP